MALAGTIGSQSGTPTTIFNSATDGEATTIMVECPGAQTDDLQVQIPELHSTAWFTLPKGDKEYFRVNDGGISNVSVRSDKGGISDVRWGVVAITGVWR